MTQVFGRPAMLLLDNECFQFHFALLINCHRRNLTSYHSLFTSLTILTSLTFITRELSFKMAVHFFAIFFTINILCWIDLVSPQFFPSMHPLTHFAIQAWGAEKMRCQNIIISSSSLQGGGYYPPRLSEENIRICRTNGQSQASNGNLNLNQ